MFNGGRLIVAFGVEIAYLRARGAADRAAADGGGEVRFAHRGAGQLRAARPDLATLLEGLVENPGQRIAVVVSGANIDPGQLLEILNGEEPT